METGEARVVSSRARVRRVARLRRWLLGGVVVLLVVLAGLLGYARYRAHRFLADLPRRLGIDVKSETNGFTYSQSSKGHTLFTVHAAKAIQRANGKTTLHDVAITLYGPQGSNRTDSIRGDAFEYDQPNGVVRATGEVHLDLAAPAPNGADPNPGVKRITVTTSGLVFLQKLGVAATDEPIQILYGDLHGVATGADYESDTGMLRLRKDVSLDGTQDGQAIHIDAAAAELDRATQVATLHGAHVRSNGSRSSGDRMTFTLAKGGGIQAVDAEGNVTLDGEGDVHATAPRLHLQMSGTGKPAVATMSGGVKLLDGDDTGSATDALIRFDLAGRPIQADFQHEVRLDSAASAGGAHSTLTAGRVVAQLLENGKRTEIREAVASGGAELRSVQSATAAGSKEVASERTTIVAAATLHATTSVSNGVRYVSAVDGSGSTRIDESDSDGNTRSSSGDTLQATLLPNGKGAHSGSGVFKTAVQTGHVVITQHTRAKPASANTQPQDSRATAQRAEFDGASQRLVLTGSPQVTGPGVQIAADRIALAQGAGDTEAQGGVRGTLVQQTAAGAGDPVHVSADRASIAGGGGARFFAGREAVRMWSSTAQLQASEIDLDRSSGTLAAHSGPGSKNTVRLVLPVAAAPRASGGKVGTARESGVTLVTGREMVMTGAAAGQASGHIDVSNDVRVVSAGSDLRADHVVATLKPAAKGQGAPVNATMNPPVIALGGGSIESILATGGVRLQQPGRIGTGERLLYTEADTRYQLTGTADAAPIVIDSLRGSITGTTLILHGGDDSVEVAGESGKRVHTETHAARPARGR